MNLSHELIHVWLWAPITLLCLAGAVFQAFKMLFQKPHKLKETPFNIIGLIVLTVGIGFQGSGNISIIGSLGTSLIALAWCVHVFSLLINLKLKTSLITLLVNPLIFLFIVFGLRFGEIQPPSNTNPLERIHIFLTLLGLTVTLLAAVTSTVFCLQDLKLKRHIQTPLVLPSLDLIHRLIQIFDKSALLFLTAAIGTGALYANDLYGPGWSSQMPWIFIFTLISWTILAGIVFANWNKWLIGRKLALSNLFLFVIVLFSLLGSHH